MLTSWSEQFTPPALSIASVKMQPAVERVLDAPALGEAEVAALADDAAAQLVAVDADAVVRSVPGLCVRLLGALHVGADPAAPQQVDRRAEDRLDELAGRERLGVDTERTTRLGGDRDRLRRAREHAAARGDQRAVVVVPGRARDPEEPLALGEAGGGVGVRVEEHVPVVEGRHEPDVPAEQHPVAEHVAGHVADPDDRDLLVGDVDAQAAEVAAHGLPRAARGDPHALVVVAGRAAGGERVPEPEAAVGPRSRWPRRRTSPCPCPPPRRGTHRRRRGARRPRAGRSGPPRRCR